MTDGQLPQTSGLISRFLMRILSLGSPKTWTGPGENAWPFENSWLTKSYRIDYEDEYQLYYLYNRFNGKLLGRYPELEAAKDKARMSWMEGQ